ncbi:LamB/YcsF family protein [Emticicia sp. 21SJ11W-3]|uniref:LamB/YcsF family protein n=1 Tax=Emticicia sp. 21SJ11W-3 TaxID=2916755 RepID=UPI0020A05E5E|nr:5-oxoprolinase subunit PxpA [Emticicia sp. 21SJ11W-3]UTA66413.1 LamB/YcsF family protein [Emticicia sp. 21SJ11W-3]
MPTIDLNCDMGESFGAWTMGNDEILMNYISSANIACGFHAGDATTMRKTAELALKQGVAIGAHPGFPDLQGFGRRNMQLSPQEVYDICLYQIGAMLHVTRALGGTLHHVKPHGALYNMAAKDTALAQAIAQATFDSDSKLILYGLSGSLLISEAEKAGLQTASEVFADRTYQHDGSLTPRTHANALIEDAETAVTQVIRMIKEGMVVSTQGRAIPIKADTICVHGDGLHAVAFAKALNERLKTEGIQVRAI